MNRKLLAIVALAVALAAVLVVVPLCSMAALSAAPSAAEVRAFVDANCVACHNSRTRSGNLVLEGLGVSAPQENIQVWEQTLRKIRAGIEPRPVAGVPRPDAAAVRDFVKWLESELDREALPRRSAPGIHRLNRAEYGNAIRSMLAMDVDVTKLLPVDDSSWGFDNIAEILAQNVPATAYTAASAAISRRAVEAAADSPTRRALFVCRPPAASADANVANATECARQIVSNLARRAFRRPATAEDVNALLSIYQAARRTADFDHGIESALRAILTDPRFLYRIETEPGNLASGESYRIGDDELASRLSFFLWSGPPDDALIDLAARGELHNPRVLESETRRMLQDPRAEALAVNFAGQWLNLRSMERVAPSPVFFPLFDEPLRQAMRREAEMFFASIVSEDRSVMDLLDADYTFVNERLARHYGIPGVSGSEFRRVPLGVGLEHRRGLLGKAAILTVTSTSDRTSPVFRGTWVLANLLGSPAPPPPPNVPPLAPRWTDPNLPSMREMMQEHRGSPTCGGCHAPFDPFGLALENFDGIGTWRTTHSGKPLDVTGELLDGTKFDGPVGLQKALAGHADAFVQTLTEKLFIYAMGRGIESRDMPVIRSIARDASRDNYRFSRVILGIVTNPVFQMNAKP